MWYGFSQLRLNMLNICENTLFILQKKYINKKIIFY